MAALMPDPPVDAPPSSDRFAPSLHPDIEPDDEWKSALHKQIEDGLRSLVDEAKRELESQLQEAPVDEARRNELSRQHHKAMSDIRALAVAQFNEGLSKERRLRAWSHGHATNDEFDEAIVKEQQFILDNIQRGKGDDSQWERAGMRQQQERPWDQRRPSSNLPSSPIPPPSAAPTTARPNIRPDRDSSYFPTTPIHRDSSNAYAYSRVRRDSDNTSQHSTVHVPPMHSPFNERAPPADREHERDRWTSQPFQYDEPSDFTLSAPPPPPHPGQRPIQRPTPSPSTSSYEMGVGNTERRPSASSLPKMMPIPEIWKPSISPEQDAATSSKIYSPVRRGSSASTGSTGGSSHPGSGTSSSTTAYRPPPISAPATAIPERKMDYIDPGDVTGSSDRERTPLRSNDFVDPWVQSPLTKSREKESERQSYQPIASRGDNYFFTSAPSPVTPARPSDPPARNLQHPPSAPPSAFNNRQIVNKRSFVRPFDEPGSRPPPPPPGPSSSSPPSAASNNYRPIPNKRSFVRTVDEPDRSTSLPSLPLGTQNNSKQSITHKRSFVGGVDDRPSLSLPALTPPSSFTAKSVTNKRSFTTEATNRTTPVSSYSSPQTSPSKRSAGGGRWVTGPPTWTAAEPSFSREDSNVNNVGGPGGRVWKQPFQLKSPFTKQDLPYEPGAVRGPLILDTDDDDEEEESEEEEESGDDGSEAGRRALEEFEMQTKRREEEARKKEEDARGREAEAKRKEEEAKRTEEAARKTEEAARQKVEEAKRKEEEVRRLEEEAKKKEEAARKKEEEAKRKEEEIRLREETVKRREEELNRREALARTREEERKQEEAKRKMEEERKRLQQEEFRKREEDIRRRTEERKRQDSVGSSSGWNVPGRTSTSSTSASNVKTNPSTSPDRSSTGSSNWSSAGSSWSSSSGGRTSGTTTSSTGSHTSRTTSASQFAASSSPPSEKTFGKSSSTFGKMNEEEEEEWTRRQAELLKEQQERFRREQERLERERQMKAASSGRIPTQEEIVQLMARHERQWDMLAKQEELRWDSFPWPSVRGAGSAIDLNEGTIGGYVGKSKERIKEQIRRWHPDRFETRFLPKVIFVERAKVKEGADTVVRSLTNLSDSPTLGFDTTSSDPLLHPHPLFTRILPIHDPLFFDDQSDNIRSPLPPFATPTRRHSRLPSLGPSRNAVYFPSHKLHNAFPIPPPLFTPTATANTTPTATATTTAVSRSSSILSLAALAAPSRIYLALSDTTTISDPSSAASSTTTTSSSYSSNSSSTPSSSSHVYYQPSPSLNNLPSATTHTSLSPPFLTSLDDDNLTFPRDFDKPGNVNGDSTTTRTNDEDDDDDYDVQARLLNSQSRWSHYSSNSLHDLSSSTTAAAADPVRGENVCYEKNGGGGGGVTEAKRKRLRSFISRLSGAPLALPNLLIPSPSSSLAASPLSLSSTLAGDHGSINTVTHTHGSRSGPAPVTSRTAPSSPFRIGFSIASAPADTTFNRANKTESCPASPASPRTAKSFNVAPSVRSMSSGSVSTGGRDRYSNSVSTPNSSGNRSLYNVGTAPVTRPWSRRGGGGGRRAYNPAPSIIISPSPSRPTPHPTPPPPPPPPPPPSIPSRPATATNRPKSAAVRPTGRGRSSTVAVFSSSSSSSANSGGGTGLGLGLSLGAGGGRSKSRMSLMSFGREKDKEKEKEKEKEKGKDEGNGGRERSGSGGSGGTTVKDKGKSKRTLVVSGLAPNDQAGFQAVRAWCEEFGEVRSISRKDNGSLHIDFRKWSVADTVCRVQAQVHIKGAGSVSLSWYSTKKSL